MAKSENPFMKKLDLKSKSKADQMSVNSPKTNQGKSELFSKKPPVRKMAKGGKTRSC